MSKHERVIVQRWVNHPALIAEVNSLRREGKRLARQIKAVRRVAHELCDCGEEHCIEFAYREAILDALDEGEAR